MLVKAISQTVAAVVVVVRPTARVWLTALEVSCEMHNTLVVSIRSVEICLMPPMAQVRWLMTAAMAGLPVSI